jgi:hypothetical protein
MQAKSGQVHIFGVRRCIQSTENQPKPLCVSGLNSYSAAGLEKFFQAFVLEASNHFLNVPCNVSGVNAHNPRVQVPGLKRSKPFSPAMYYLNVDRTSILKGKTSKHPVLRFSFSHGKRPRVF